MSILKYDKTIAKHFSAASSWLLDLLFPRECLGCGQEGSWLCRRCRGRIEINNTFYCLNCRREGGFGRFCPDCRNNFALDGVWVAGDYNNPLLAKIIKHYKYRFIQELDSILGWQATAFLMNLINLASVTKKNIAHGLGASQLATAIEAPGILAELRQTLFMPVPLSKKRLRWRGFNQAEKLAEITADHFGMKINNGLIRYRHQRPQATLSKAKRAVNIKNSFRWQGNNLNGRSVLLIDDVTTTGATLNEAARVLKENGAGEVWGLVVAHG